jgi:undecaprenyl-diphosphatase
MDTKLFHTLNNLIGKSSTFDNLVVFLASYLPYIVLVGFFVFLLCSKYDITKKLRIFWTTALSTAIAFLGITQVIRYFYHRPRPFTALDTPHLLTNNEWSFPSGHATFFFALATIIYLYNKKWGFWFFLFAVLITINRIIAGIHYPSDIIGGLIIGGLTSCIVYYLLEKRKKI